MVSSRSREWPESAFLGRCSSRGRMTSCLRGADLWKVPTVRFGPLAATVTVLADFPRPLVSAHSAICPVAETTFRACVESAAPLASIFRYGNSPSRTPGACDSLGPAKRVDWEVPR